MGTTPYWTGQVNGHKGEKFSFYRQWIVWDELCPQDDGYLIVIRTATGIHKLWITEETMTEILTDGTPRDDIDKFEIKRPSAWMEELHRVLSEAPESPHAHLPSPEPS